MLHSILICDDDPLLAGALRRVLIEAGHLVAVVGCGQETLAAVASDPPDLLLLDRMLPDMDGLDVCRRLRATFTGPIIIMSGQGEPLDRVLGLELGADAYVVKPFGYREFVARVEAQLRRADTMAGEVHPAGVLRIGELVVDIHGHEVTREGCPLHLTAKEFDLLAVLIRQQGAAVRSSRLLLQVWGYDASIRTRTLEVHVGRLRAKIEPDPRRPSYLLTVPGVGYRLCAPDGVSTAA